MGFWDELAGGSGDLWGSLINTGIQAWGASQTAKAAKQAAQQQVNAANQGNDLQWQMYLQNRADQAPWRNVGGGAIGQLGNLMGIGGAGRQRPGPPPGWGQQPTGQAGQAAQTLRTIGQQNSPGGQDSQLVHVNPAEVQTLKAMGGSGRTDPQTGLMHFYDPDSGSSGSYDSGSEPGGGYDPGGGYSSGSYGGAPGSGNGGYPSSGLGSGNTGLGSGNNWNSPTTIPTTGIETPLPGSTPITKYGIGGWKNKLALGYAGVSAVTGLPGTTGALKYGITPRDYQTTYDKWAAGQSGGGSGYNSSGGRGSGGGSGSGNGGMSYGNVQRPQTMGGQLSNGAGYPTGGPNIQTAPGGDWATLTPEEQAQAWAQYDASNPAAGGQQTMGGQFGSMSTPFSGTNWQVDPGYQFRLNEGQKALERSAAARGGLMSGGTLKAIQGYGQEMGSQEYGNAYNRYNNDQTNLFNRYASLAGMGQTATNQVGSYGANMANQMGQNYGDIGNAQSAGTIAGSNAWTNALNNTGNVWQQYLSGGY